MSKITDQQGRYFKSLRLSVLPYCNLACTYCVDPEAEQYPELKASLMPKQFLKLVSALHDVLDLYSIRLTGGEPTLYKALPELVSRLKDLGIPKVHLTTNGVYLASQIAALKAAGLDSINVSIDAIDHTVFQKISRRNKLDAVLEGIDVAIASGTEVKLNCTMIKGVNDSEIIPLVLFAKEKRVTIRFLELMEMGALYSSDQERLFLSAHHILDQIRQHYRLRELPRKRSATARYWETEWGTAIGVIANYSHPFCSDCNRLRMDYTGTLYGCLSSPKGSSLMKALENGESVRDLLQCEINRKQAKQFKGSPVVMKAIGG